MLSHDGGCLALRHRVVIGVAPEASQGQGHKDGACDEKWESADNVDEEA